MTIESKHLVISIPGGPLALVYGTPAASPKEIEAELRNIFDASLADSMKIICVDPNTDTSTTPDLANDESGFIFPHSKGSGWNAKLYDKPELKGKLIAGFHLYCGSGSTNLNNGQWMKEIPGKFKKKTIEKLEEMFPELDIVEKNYGKEIKQGAVDARLQSLTKTPYSDKLLGK